MLCTLGSRPLPSFSESLGDPCTKTRHFTNPSHPDNTEAPPSLLTNQHIHRPVEPLWRLQSASELGMLGRNKSQRHQAVMFISTPHTLGELFSCCAFPAASPPAASSAWLCSLPSESVPSPVGFAPSICTCVLPLPNTPHTATPLRVMQVLAATWACDLPSTVPLYSQQQF